MLSDKRKQKTISCIKQAFMQLCKDNVASQITVSKLASKAQINRTTFYLHYQSVNDVMQDIDNDLKVRISSYVDAIDIDAVYESCYATFTRLTDKLNENVPLRDYIFDSCSSSAVLDKLKKVITEKTISAIIEVYPSLTYEQLKFPSTFLIAGIADTYAEWTHSDKSVTLDELIKILSKLTCNALDFISAIAK